jgi:hypothetical protein
MISSLDHERLIIHIVQYIVWKLYCLLVIFTFHFNNLFCMYIRCYWKKLSFLDNLTRAVSQVCCIASLLYRKFPSQTSDFGIRSAFVRHSFGIRSAFVRHSFGIHSAFVRHSFGIRSAFIRHRQFLFGHFDQSQSRNTTLDKTFKLVILWYTLIIYNCFLLYLCFCFLFIIHSRTSPTHSLSYTLIFNLYIRAQTLNPWNQIKLLMCNSFYLVTICHTQPEQS